MAPGADQERLRIICDWGNWIFPFDDIFDNGNFSDDYSGACAIISRLLSVFDEDHKSLEVQMHATASLVGFHDDIWARIKEKSSSSIAQLYARAMMDYCAGTLDQVQHAEKAHGNNLEHMLSMRRQSVCVATLFALVQFGHDIVLPDFVSENTTIKEIECIGIDLTLMHNDLLSYDKEDAEGVPHNLVAVCRAQGMSAQMAVDCVAELINSRHVQLNRAMGNVPSWDKETDSQVTRYLLGIQDVIKANLYWSFRSARFLTDRQKESILTSRTIDLRS